MSNTGPTGPEFLKGKKCPSCGSPAVARSRFIFVLDDNIKYYCCHQCGCQWDTIQYPNYETPPLKERYEAVVEEYVIAFCKKQGFNRSDGYWVGDRIGEIFDLAAIYFYFRDIRFDVDTNQAEGRIFDWYWKKMKIDDHTTSNYENWCKMKPNTEEEK